jgi:hypothetical protein
MARKVCVTRRAAIAGAAALPIVHIHASAAAGKLSVAFITSFVPGWNETIQRLVETWANGTLSPLRSTSST